MWKGLRYGPSVCLRFPDGGLGAELRAERGHSSYGDRYIDGPYGLHVDHLVRSPVPGILAPPSGRRGGGLWTTVAEGL